MSRANVIAATEPDLPNGITNTGTSKSVSLKQLALKLSQCFSSQRFSVSGVADHAEPRAGDIRHSLGSPDRAKAELGFTAEVPLEKALGARPRVARAKR